MCINRSVFYEKIKNVFLQENEEIKLNINKDSTHFSSKIQKISNIKKNEKKRKELNVEHNNTNNINDDINKNETSSHKISNKGKIHNIFNE